MRLWSGKRLYLNLEVRKNTLTLQEQDFLDQDQIDQKDVNQTRISPALPLVIARNRSLNVCRRSREFKLPVDIHNVLKRSADPISTGNLVHAPALHEFPVTVVNGSRANSTRKRPRKRKRASRFQPAA
jgi:hypothetical protein